MSLQSRSPPNRRSGTGPALTPCSISPHPARIAVHGIQSRPLAANRVRQLARIVRNRSRRPIHRHSSLLSPGQRPAYSRGLVPTRCNTQPDIIRAEIQHAKTRRAQPNFLLLFREQNRGVLDRIMTGDHHFADIPEQPPTDKLPPDADGRLPALPPGSAPPSAPTEASTRQPGRPIDKMLHKPDRAH